KHLYLLIDTADYPLRLHAKETLVPANERSAGFAKLPLGNIDPALGPAFQDFAEHQSCRCSWLPLSVPQQAPNLSRLRRLPVQKQGFSALSSDLAIFGKTNNSFGGPI